MCRIGGRLRSWYASIGGVDVEIPPFKFLISNLDWERGWGPCMVGSLTGAVTS